MTVDPDKLFFEWTGDLEKDCFCATGPYRCRVTQDWNGWQPLVEYLVNETTDDGHSLATYETLPLEYDKVYLGDSAREVCTETVRRHARQTHDNELRRSDKVVDLLIEQRNRYLDDVEGLDKQLTGLHKEYAELQKAGDQLRRRLPWLVFVAMVGGFLVGRGIGLILATIQKGQP